MSPHPKVFEPLPLPNYLYDVTMHLRLFDSNHYINPIIIMMMMMMIHSISSAPFICNIYIQRRLAPQIVIIWITYLLKRYVLKPALKCSRSSVLRRMARIGSSRSAEQLTKHGHHTSSLHPTAASLLMKSRLSSEPFGPDLIASFSNSFPRPLSGSLCMTAYKSLSTILKEEDPPQDVPLYL